MAVIRRVRAFFSVVHFDVICFLSFVVFVLFSVFADEIGFLLVLSFGFGVGRSAFRAVAVRAVLGSCIFSGSWARAAVGCLTCTVIGCYGVCVGVLGEDIVLFASR